LFPGWPKHVVMTSFSCELMTIFNLVYMLRSEIENAHWAEKMTTMRSGIRDSHNTKCRIVAVLKQPQSVVALEKQPQCEVSWK